MVSDVPGYCALFYLQCFATATLLCLAHAFIHPLYLFLSVTSSFTTLNFASVYEAGCPAYWELFVALKVRLGPLN